MEPNTQIQEDQKEKTTTINLQTSPENIGKNYIQELSDSIENNNLFFGIFVSIVGAATISLIILVQISSIVITTEKITYAVGLNETMGVLVIALSIGFAGCIISANTANINNKKRNKIFGIEGSEN